MNNQIQILKDDIAECEKLKSLSNRSSVKKTLEKMIQDTQLMIEQLEPNETKKQVSSQATIKTITNFAWDQSSDNVKIYLTVPGVVDMSSEAIFVDFQEKSVEVKITRSHNVIERFFSNLNKEIDTSKCTYKIKNSNIIYLSLAKKETNWWSELRKSKPNNTKVRKYFFVNFQENFPKIDDTKKDPGSSLMDLMKNIYETGDEEMKRTIAKAWTESQQKINTGGSL